MKKDNLVYLRQINDYIKDITGYIKDKSSQEFEKDRLLQDGVIRKLELIGETARRLSDDFVESHPEFPLSEAVATRNKLIHDYDEINLKIVWNTLTKDLPRLKRVVSGLLK